MTSGQWFVSPEGTRWHFDAGSLSLDFAYTGDFELGQPKWERLHRADDLTQWMRAHLPFPVAEVTNDDLARARRLRAAISLATRTLTAGDAVAETDAAVIDEAAAHPDVPPRLRIDGEGVPAPVERALSTIARDFITTVAVRRDRLKVCAADDCGLMFLDTSRPGSRRWCSMQRCGNRAKVRQFRTNAHN